MNKLETEIRDAFDSVTLPDDVRAETLAAIAQRAEQEADGTQAEQRGQGPASEQRSATDHRDDEPAFRPRVVHRRGLIAAIAACFILCLVGFGGFTAFSTETAQVGIDVNPSIELGLNGMNRVVEARGINEDGRNLIDGMNLWGKTYEEAMRQISESSQFDAYVTPESYLQITVTSDSADQVDELQRESDAYLQELPCEGSCHSADAAQRAAAVEAGMGVGRYQAAQQLMALYDTMTLDDCRNMTMRQLRDAIAQAGGDQSVPTESGAHDGSGQGEGAGNGVGQGDGAGVGTGSGHGMAAGNGTGSGSGQGNGASHNGSSHE